MEIAVLIITRKRPNLLRRAIASIKNQCCSESIKIFICIDDCVETMKFLEQHYGGEEYVSWMYKDRTREEKSGPGRSAYLRNLAVEHVSAEWISFLDDDNEFESFHFAELVDSALKNNAEAVHCYRKLFYADGTPYCFTDGLYPWARNTLQAKKLFEYLSENGIIEKGSNIIKDQIGTADKEVNLVDTNVWLIKRDVLLKNKIPENFTNRDWTNIVCEDDKMLQSLIDSKVKIICNQVPSVRYYLGGYSNVDYLNTISPQNVHFEEWNEDT